MSVAAKPIIAKVRLLSAGEPWNGGLCCEMRLPTLNLFTGTEAWKPRGPIHTQISTSSIKSSKVWSLALCDFSLSFINISPPLQHPGTTSYRFQGPHPNSDVRFQYPHRRRVVVYDWPTLCCPRERFLCYQICRFFYVGEMIASSMSSPGEYSTR